MGNSSSERKRISVRVNDIDTMPIEKIREIGEEFKKILMERFGYTEKEFTILIENLVPKTFFVLTGGSPIIHSS